MSCARAATVALASVLVMACSGRSESPQASSPPSPAPQRATPLAATAPHESVDPVELPVEPVEPALLLPGKFGPDTTIADLQAWYGKANMQVGDVPGPEGTTEQGAILFPNDPTRRAYVYFHDGTQPRRLASVEVFDPESRWQLERGVRLGMKFDALRRLNGKPFQFGGLGWDYGGYAGEWNGGTLDARDGDTMSIGVRLDASEQAQVQGDTYPIGEGVFSSDDPAWPHLGQALIVSKVSVHSPREGE